MPMYLVPIDEGELIPLDKAILFIGRDPDCDVVLSNSRKVSRKHCCIALINRTLVVRDLGSMNGVRVNDHVTRDERKIRIGDEVWIGDTGFRLEYRDTPPGKKDTSSRAGSGAPSPRHVSVENQAAKERPFAIPEQEAELIVEKSDIRPTKTPPPPPSDQEESDQDVIALRDSDILSEDTE